MKTKQDKKILMILTGGTFGMLDGEKALKPSAINGELILKIVPELNTLAQLEWLSIFDLDSSDISPKHWVNIGNNIRNNYHKYDGFVVIHGTDTMVYSATAVSFMMRATEKPIIFTGSQRPLSACRNDARKNLIDAIEYARRDINEVAICFNSRLIRGCRAKKISVTDYNAFESPNYPCLASSGVEIEVNKLVLKKQGAPEWSFDFDSSIVLIKVFPGLDSKIYENLVLSEKVKAIIIEGFGSGNIPELDTKWLSLIQNLKKLKKLVVITSQCNHGLVKLDSYENGLRALEAGAISCSDITSEACVVKIMFFLSKKFDYQELKKEMQHSYCGELN